MASIILAFITIFVGTFAAPVPTTVYQSTVNNDGLVLIVGGQDAPEGAFPYQVSIRKPDGTHHCGGSIIKHDVILTAAHCIRGDYDISLSVVAGTNKIGSGGTTYTVKNIKIHENFKDLQNDIALLKLSKSIVYSDRIQPIELARSGPKINDTAAVLTGWGMTQYPGPIPANLQYLTVTTISISDCKSRHHGTSLPVGDSQICTLTKSGQGACKGDSGGPLVADNRQIGIVSWGTPCAVGKPDVFTKVSAYIGWINKNWH